MNEKCHQCKGPGPFNAMTRITILGRFILDQLSLDQCLLCGTCFDCASIACFRPGFSANIGTVPSSRQSLLTESVVAIPSGSDEAVPSGNGQAELEQQVFFQALSRIRDYLVH